MIMVRCSDYCDGNGLCIKNTRAALSQPSVSVEELADFTVRYFAGHNYSRHEKQECMGFAQAILAKYNVTVKE